MVLSSEAHLSQSVTFFIADQFVSCGVTSVRDHETHPAVSWVVKNWTRIPFYKKLIMRGHSDLHISHSKIRNRWLT